MMQPHSPSHALAHPGGARQRPGATALSDRQWGPDVARGVALLGILMSNMYYYLYGSPSGVMMKPLESPNWGSTAVDVLTILLFDNRGFTLFSLLFGFGIAHLHARSQARGDTAGRFYVQMLIRHGVLAVIGLIHLVFLFAGDIIMTYAFFGLIVSAVVLAPRWCQILVAVWGAAGLVLMGAMDGFVDPELGTSFTPLDVVASSYGSALVMRSLVGMFMVPLTWLLGFGVLLPMLLGVWLYRIGFFTKAADRAGTMLAVAIGGLAISLAGAAPVALLYVGDENVSLGWSVAAGILHQITGVVGAVSYAATAALLAARKPKVLAPLAALGTMSMSAYLAQSVVSVAVYPAYTAGFGEHFDSLHAAGVSLATWVATLIVASILVRAGKRGPMEWVFRFIAYAGWSKQPSPAPPVSGQVSSDSR